MYGGGGGGVTYFQVISISIAFVTPDQQIVPFSLSPLYFPIAVYYELPMYYLIVILIVCFLIGQMNNNHNNDIKTMTMEDSFPCELIDN